MIQRKTFFCIVYYWLNVRNVWKYNTGDISEKFPNIFLGFNFLGVWYIIQYIFFFRSVFPWSYDTAFIIKKLK